MKRCQRCNVDFSADLRFCTSCGSALVDAPSIPVKSTQASSVDRETFIRCPTCKGFIRSDATACEHCGLSLIEATIAPTALPPPASPIAEPSRPNPAPTEDIRLQDWYVAPEPVKTTSLQPAADFRYDVPSKRLRQITSPKRNDKTAPELSGFEAYGGSNKTTASTRSWRGALLLLFVLIFAGGLGVGGWWWSGRDSNEGSKVTPNPAPAASESPAQRTTTSSSNLSAVVSADDELKKLRERRLGSRPANNSKIVADIEEVEKKYPTDYRFPYERAKLSIKGVISHHEAFEALRIAAGRALDNGKSQEMLNDIIVDKEGDFYKLSRGHHEWEAIEEALRSKDKSKLTAKH